MTAGKGTQRALLIDDAGIASLVAALLIDDASTIVARFAPPAGDPSAPPRLEALRRRADLLGFADVVVAQSPPIRSNRPDLTDAAHLLAAADDAARLGCQRVVIPWHFGGDLDALADAADRVRLLERLINLTTAPGSRLTLDLPLLDLHDAQIVELARDLDAPIATAARWCERPGEHPCTRCDPCRRWAEALQGAPEGASL